jgi:hypothetical protein
MIGTSATSQKLKKKKLVPASPFGVQKFSVLQIFGSFRSQIQ